MASPWLTPAAALQLDGDPLFRGFDGPSTAELEVGAAVRRG